MTNIFKVFFVIFLLKYVQARGVNGGFSCGACTIMFGIASQLAEIHNKTIVAASLKVCDLLPNAAATFCKEEVQKLVPVLSDPEVIKFFTADVLCYGIRSCYVDPGESYCHLFPKPLTDFELNVYKVQKLVKTHLKEERWPKQGFDFCSLPVIKEICWIFDEHWTNMLPAVDVDGDLFSLLPSARGWNWRGRDCRDFDPASYPGRGTAADPDTDHDCNGISGRDERTGGPYEAELCGSSGARGLVYVGDSVGAHFHFPQAWMDPGLITWDSMHNYTTHLLDELDWPQLGFATGFINTTETILIQGYTDSIYLKLLNRNRCNHRDYQNLSRNGASSFDLTSYVKNIARNSTTDKPALVIYGAFGNDVCNMFKDTLANMTKPTQFRKNVLSVLMYLNATLPSNSHVLLIGLVDGEFIYPTMGERLHPLGKLRGDVLYRDLYDWFTCMQFGPCVGWMNSNSTLRKLTSKRAKKLNDVLESLAASEKFQTFMLHYTGNPLKEVFDDWKQQGREAWRLIDPIDSLHPSQLAQPLIANALWEDLLNKFPEILGSVNPNNKKIQDLFGDQGGH